MGAQETTLRDPPPNYFRFAPTGAQTTAGLGTYAYRDLGWRRAVVVAEDWYPGWEARGGLRRRVLRAGRERGRTRLVRALRLRRRRRRARRHAAKADGVLVIATSGYAGSLPEGIRRSGKAGPRAAAPERRCVPRPEGAAAAGRRPVGRGDRRRSAARVPARTSCGGIAKRSPESSRSCRPGSAREWSSCPPTPPSRRWSRHSTQTDGELGSRTGRAPTDARRARPRRAAGDGPARPEPAGVRGELPRAHRAGRSRRAAPDAARPQDSTASSRPSTASSARRPRRRPRPTRPASAGPRRPGRRSSPDDRPGEPRRGRVGRQPARPQPAADEEGRMVRATSRAPCGPDPRRPVASDR